MILVFILGVFVVFQVGYAAGKIRQYYILKDRWRYWMAKGGYHFLDGKGDS